MSSIPVKYLHISEEKYQKLENKDIGTFYLTEENLYLGNIQLNVNNTSITIN